MSISGVSQLSPGMEVAEQREETREKNLIAHFEAMGSLVDDKGEKSGKFLCVNDLGCLEEEASMWKYWGSLSSGSLAKACQTSWEDLFQCIESETLPKLPEGQWQKVVQRAYSGLKEIEEEEEGKNQPSLVDVVNFVEKRAAEPKIAMYLSSEYIGRLKVKKSFSNVVGELSAEKKSKKELREVKFSTTEIQEALPLARACNDMMRIAGDNPLMESLHQDWSAYNDTLTDEEDEDEEEGSVQQKSKIPSFSFSKEKTNGESAAVQPDIWDCVGYDEVRAGVTRRRAALEQSLIMPDEGNELTESWLLVPPSSET